MTGHETHKVLLAALYAAEITSATPLGSANAIRAMRVIAGANWPRDSRWAGQQEHERAAARVFLAEVNDPDYGDDDPDYGDDSGND